MLGKNFSLLAVLLLTATAVSAIPALETRQDASGSDNSSLTVVTTDSVLQYTSDNGTIDLFALIEDTKVVPISVDFVNAVSATSVSVPTAALVASAKAAATQSPIITTTIDASAPDQTDSPSARKRDAPAPAWDSTPGVCPDPGTNKGPTLRPDTPENFAGNSNLNQVYARGSSANAPTGYSRAFIAKDGVSYIPDQTNILGFYQYDSYDVAGCASDCSKDPKCQAFNFFLLRNTIVDFGLLSSSQLAKCNNPPSLTQFWCSRYSSTITGASTTNKSQYKGPVFKTAIAASNGYNVASTVLPTLAGYNSALYPGGTVDGKYTTPYLLEVFNANSNPQANGFSPEICAARCDARKAKCAGFNTAQMTKDGVFSGTLCLLYTVPIPESQAKNPGQWQGSSWVSTQPTAFYTKSSYSGPAFSTPS